MLLCASAGRVNAQVPPRHHIQTPTTQAGAAHNNKPVDRNALRPFSYVLTLSVPLDPSGDTTFRHAVLLDYYDSLRAATKGVQLLLNSPQSKRNCASQRCDQLVVTEAKSEGQTPGILRLRIDSDPPAGHLRSDTTFTCSSEMAACRQIETVSFQNIISAHTQKIHPAGGRE